MILLLFPRPVTAEEGDAEFAYAAGYFKKDRWKYASEAFAEFLQKHPKHSRAHMAQLYYGLALNRMDEFKAAREQLRKFVTEYPSSQNIADARFHVAECSYNLGEFRPAVTEFTEYMTKHEGHNLRAWAGLMLGESHNALAQWQEAVATLEELLKSPFNAAITPDATFALGVALQGQQRSEDALKAFGKVIEMKSPALTDRAMARIGTTHFKNKDYAKASAVYDQIVKEFPEREIAASAALQSGISQFQLDDFDEALIRLGAVPESSPAGTQAAMWMGFCYRELGQLDTARKALSIAFKEAEDTPLGAEILYNRAQVELLDKHKATAAQMFLDLSDRWPKNHRVADSLFNAAQLKLELADSTASKRIIDRLRAEFPAKVDEPAVRVLTGRLLLSDGNFDAAIEQLAKAVAAPSNNARQKLFRQYHLIRALHRGEKYTDVVSEFESMRPVLQASEATEFCGAAALAAMSSLETKQFAKAQLFADDFLALEQDPEKQSDALAARAVALASMKQFKESQADLNSLVQTAAANPQTWRAVLQSAEAAWEQDAFDVAASFFELACNARLADITESIHESALFGAAWSRYNLGQFEKSASLFKTISEKYPNSGNAVEAAYMEAISAFDAKDEKAATEQLRALYEKLDRLPNDNSDRKKYLLDAGQLYAKLLGKAGRVPDANIIWERLATTFSESVNADSILDSWAFMNLENRQYSKSDEIYRQLLEQFPESSFAGQARLSLAESEMQANRLDTALKEFTAIVQSTIYGAVEKESALYHVVDIHAAQREWLEVLKYGEMFAEEFSASERAPRMQLLYAEALLDQKRYAEAKDTLAVLRDGIRSGQLPADPWTERVWIVISEIALAEKRYADIDLLEEEFLQRTPKSKFLFQLHDIQGRRWKSQANPNFEKSREYFARVIRDENGRRTTTAARCQFLIGETLLLQNNHAAALKEYYRVYLNYPFTDWRARGLFQAAGCEVALNDINAAKRSYGDLIQDFPASEWAKQAMVRLKELNEKG